MPARPFDDTDSTLDKQVDWHLLRRVYGSEAVSSLFTMLVATVLGTVVAVYAPGGLLPFAWWLVIDNFGGGRSSFSLLKELPGDYLAIDGGYVRTMSMEPANHAIVEAIHKVGHAHGMQTLAKSVESRETLDALQAIGVDFAQGHHIGGVLPATGLDAIREPDSDVVQAGPGA